MQATYRLPAKALPNVICYAIHLLLCVSSRASVGPVRAANAAFWEMEEELEVICP